MTVPPFHLAFPVRDLASSRRFYGGLLGCTEGRSSDRWIDFDFYGHQIVAHMVDGIEPAAPDHDAESNAVDGHDVPVPHFGLVLPWQTWHELADRLRAGGTTFVIEPYLRFEGLPGEQATMFLLDPSGNALEFKAFKDPAQLFAT
ncbi:MAG: VOC family protein [Phycisphaerales bacterium]|nr:VOC family protein [Phycisphaerales bacterium]